MGHHDPLAADVLQPLRLHLAQHPVDRGLEAGRPGQPVAEPVHQLAQAAVGGAVPGRGPDQAVGGEAVVPGDIAPLGGGRRRSRNQSQQAEDEAESGHGLGRNRWR